MKISYPNRVVYLTVLLITLFSSCGGEKERFDYEAFYIEFETQVKKGISFDQLVEDFYFGPKNFNTSPRDEFPHSFNKVNLAFLSSFFVDSNIVVDYYWDEEIMNTPYSAYLDTSHCDCNLVVSPKEQVDFVEICFYQKKVYSIAAFVDSVSGEVSWER